MTVMGAIPTWGDLYKFVLGKCNSTQQTYLQEQPIIPKPQFLLKSILTNQKKAQNIPK